MDGCFTCARDCKCLKVACAGHVPVASLVPEKKLNWHEYIKLPRLDIEGHEWTMEGQVLKMLEELGEVSQALNKEQDLEKTAAEALDFIMTGVTLLNMLESKGVDVNAHFKRFTDKLEKRNYLLRVLEESTKTIPVVRKIG
jgi:NTP pyrophosphatase (non-canonical NTP hydrolase)